jgi:hypothetical protein
MRRAIESTETTQDGWGRILERLAGFSGHSEDVFPTLDELPSRVPSEDLEFKLCFSAKFNARFREVVQAWIRRSGYEARFELAKCLASDTE